MQLRAVDAGRVRAALAWTDPPASFYTPKQLVNDLDLSITVSGAAPVLGNGGAVADDTNTVEVAEADVGARVAFNVTVNATALPWSLFGTHQPYALVISFSGTFEQSPTLSTGRAPPDTEQCVDTPGWRDKDGDSCVAYVYRPWDNCGLRGYEDSCGNCCACKGLTLCARQPCAEDCAWSNDGECDDAPGRSRPRWQ